MPKRQPDRTPDLPTVTHPRHRLEVLLLALAVRHILDGGPLTADEKRYVMGAKRQIDAVLGREG